MVSKKGARGKAQDSPPGPSIAFTLHPSTSAGVRGAGEPGPAVTPLVKLLHRWGEHRLREQREVRHRKSTSWQQLLYSALSNPATRTCQCAGKQGIVG